MSNKEVKEYMSVKEFIHLLLDKPMCHWLMLVGERSNGKSFVAKSYFIQEAFKSIKEGVCNNQFAYVRRFDRDSKDSVTEPYFADMPVQALTNNQYSSITVYRKHIYLSNHNPKTHKVERGVCIGQCFALASAEHYKSLMYPHINNIVFEEFINEKNQYLFRECDKFQQLVSTILRDRVGKVVLIGNTLSRLCPWYEECGLVGAEELGLNETRVYNLDGTIIKVHRCDSKGNLSNMFFGNAKKNIAQGEYYTTAQPHLEKKLEEYNIVHQIVLEYNHFKYLMRFIYDPKECCYMWYVEPKTTPIKPNTRVISNQFNASPYYTNGFVPINEMEKRALRYIDLRKVVFNSNLTGTEFYNIIDKMDI